MAWPDDTGGADSLPFVRTHVDKRVASKETRLSVSSGVAFASFALEQSAQYWSTAMVPTPPFRSLTAHEASRWIMPSNALYQPTHDVALVVLDTEPVRMLRRLLENVSSREDALQAASSVETRSALTAIVGEVSRRFISAGEIHPLGISIDEGGQLTTTYDRAIGQKIGLHVDSWDRKPTTERGHARNRLALNVGASSRYLWFSNTPVSTLVRSHGLAAGGATELVRWFLLGRPRLPIMRVEIRPGEAYIAPTENLIHDGCTLGVNGWSHLTTFLGHFAPALE